MKNPITHPGVLSIDLSDQLRFDVLGPILESSADIIIVLDKDLRINMLTQSAKELLSIISGKEIGKTDYLPGYVPSSRQHLVEDIYQKLSAGQKFQQDLYLPVKENFSSYKLSFQPFQDHSGELEAVIIIVTPPSKEKEEINIYRDFFYDHPLAMWVYNIHTLQIEKANEAALAMYGYSKEEFLALKLNDLRPPEELPFLFEELEMVKSGEANTIKNFKHRKRSGEIIYVEIIGSELSTSGGSSRLISARDISDKVEVENELRLSKERFSLVSRASSDALWEWNVLTGEAFISQAYTDMLGWKVNEFRKFDEWHDYIHPDDKEKTVGPYYEALKDPKVQVWQAEYRYLKTDGSYAHVFDKAMIRRDPLGKAIKVVGALKDITVQKQVEEELRRSNERFLLASKAAPGTIYDWDIEKDILEWGEGFDQVTSIFPESLSITEWEELIHADDRGSVRINLKKTLEDPSVFFWLEEYKFRNKTQTYSYVLDRGFVIRDENGKATRLIGSLQDITSKKLNEELVSLERKIFHAASHPSKNFNEVVDVMLKGLDDIHPEAKASLMLLKEDLSIQDHCSPRIPELTSIFTGLRIAADSGSFGAAIHQKESVIVQNISADSRFSDYKDLFRQLDLQACWSQPIVHGSGRVIGCFNLFYSVQRTPTSAEKMTIERLCNILRIVWENHWSLHEIRISNERFDKIMKATHDLIWDWDLEANIIYRDAPGIQAVYGIRNRDEISDPQKWMSRIHPEDKKKVQNVIRMITDSVERDHFDVEYRFLKDDGTYSYVYDRGTIIRDNESRPVRMIGAAQNISERKRLEKELLDHELEHQKAINQATVDTQEQERREIGKELHDNINQVLTTTKLYLDLALDNTQLKDDLIAKSSKNIISVINEIRQLSRSLMDPSIGDLGLLPSINDLIENINMTRVLKISMDADEKLEDHFDPDHKLTIFRIIQEALNNAIKHAQATKVNIKFIQNPSFAQVIIEDNGIGFDVKAVKRGIGLKNIQNRIYLINGTHRIESNPNKGSRIIINFPILKTPNQNQ
jgi:PAS domain S-box-containing protein